MPEAFEFRLVGEESLDGHRSFIIEATPCQGYQPEVCAYELGIRPGLEAVDLSMHRSTVKAMGNESLQRKLRQGLGSYA